MGLSYGTICSGIDAFRVAVAGRGWKPKYVSEIERFPSEVLAHHWPETPNLGDMTLIDGEEHPVEVIVGGPPCQSFSFAGLRLSLKDARGNITLSYVRLIHATRPLRYAVYENVPGLLSTPDNAFGCLLGALVGSDAPLEPGPCPRPGRSNDFWTWKKPKGEDAFRHITKWPRAGMASGPLGRVAWRVLDAQYFGLAQRRERVFAVFCPTGSRGDPAAVLFEPQGLHRHPPARGVEGEGPAGTLSARTQGGGGLGTDFDLAGGLKPVAFAHQAGGTQTTLGFDPESKTSPTLSTTQTPAIAFALRGRDEGNVPEVEGDGQTTGALRSASGGSTNPHVAVSFGITRDALDRIGEGAGGSAGERAGLGIAHELAQTIKAKGPGAVATFITALRYAVRRLTPTECARLQGFPDDHARIPWKGKPAEACPDGPQYKAYGNSMATTVMLWLAIQIEKDAARVDLLDQEAA